MQPLLDDIRVAGFIPGLWIAPFMVGNRSRLYRDHPEWVVKDRLSGEPLTHMRFYGEFRWHKRSEEYYILDTTHPRAFEYLKRFSAPGDKTGTVSTSKQISCTLAVNMVPTARPGMSQDMTRIEIWRRVAEMIRAEIGDALWLGCRCPLWASIGLVDGVRIGRDVGVSWSGELSAQSLLRECFHYLSEAEIKTLAIYAGMSGGVMTTSDNLRELSPHRLRLWRLILSEERASCDFPLLEQSIISYERLPADMESHRVRHVPRADDPVLVQVRRPAREGAPGVIFLVNTDSHTVQCTYRLTDLGIKASVYCYHWENRSSSEQPMIQITVTLPGHHSALYFFSSEPMREAPLQLPS